MLAIVVAPQLSVVGVKWAELRSKFENTRIASYVCNALKPCDNQDFLAARCVTV